MKPRNRVWIAALCLLAATFTTVSLKARPAGVYAATRIPSDSAAAVKAAAYVAPATLRAAVAANPAAEMRVSGQQDTRVIFPPIQQFTLIPPDPAHDVNKTIVAVRFSASSSAKLPSQVPMTLANQKVILQRLVHNPTVFSTSLDFNWPKFIQEQGQRKIAASQGRMMPNFDGRHYVGRTRIQFLDPAQIQQAMQLHQPLNFPPQILEGSSQMNVFPDHQLIMNNIAVVNDVGPNGNNGRTFDQCLPSGAQGNPNGAWTFNMLMLAMANATPQNPKPAEQMVLGMLNSFNATQNINGFQVLPRPLMGTLNGLTGTGGTGMLQFWPVDTSQGLTCVGLNGVASVCPSLANAPIRLDAIVNRIDVGVNGDPFSPAGELRFIFTITDQPAVLGNDGLGPCNNQDAAQEVFNIILEYHVPSDLFPNALSWAKVWNNLPDLNANKSFDETYLSALQTTITDKVVTAGACHNSSGQAISCISQVRTNELLLGQGSQNQCCWELREFHFSNSSGSPVLAESTVAQTPDPSFNTTSPGTPLCGTVNNHVCAPAGSLAGYINFIANNTTFQQTQGAAPPVPANWIVQGRSAPFLGGSALNNQAWWLDTNLTNNPNDSSRIDFSVNTCSGCHGREAKTPFFQHVNRRTTGATSLLSFFLVGNPLCDISTENLGQGSSACRETVTDPNPAFPGVTTSFGDVARRVIYLQDVCGDSACDGGTGLALLLPFKNRPIGVH